MPRSRPRRTSRPPITFPLDTFPTAEEITARANAMFAEGGRQVPKASDYWLQAEQELLEIGARRALSLAAPPYADRRRAPDDRQQRP
jgi:hypothetical protein